MEVEGQEGVVFAEEKEVELNLNSNSMVGQSSLKTMKFKGRINQKGIVVVLDSEVTHNFIYPSISNKIHNHSYRWSKS